MSKQATPQTKRPPLLKVDNVSRKFKDQLVVEQFNLSLDQGDILGLIGLNGAGKSTTLRMLSGLLSPTTGTIKIAGFSLSDQPIEARRKIGYLPDPLALHGCLNVSETIDISARLHQIAKGERKRIVEHTLERCQLQTVSKKQVSKLSKGFKQRLGLAVALAHNPALLILDEPASGLDPAQTAHLNQLINELASDCAIILSSHAIADINACCTKIALMQNTKIQLLKPQAQTAPQSCYTLNLKKPITRAELLQVSEIHNAQSTDPASWRITLDERDLDKLLQTSINQNWGIISLTPAEAEQDSLLDKLTHQQEAV